MPRFVSYISVILLLLAGCGRDEGSIYDCTLSPQFLEGGYRKTNVSMNGLDILYDTTKFKRCEIDDVLVILTSSSPNSGDYNIADEGNRCSPSVVREGVWTLTGDTLMLDQQLMKVSNFTCLGFEVEYRAPNISNNSQMADYKVIYSKVRP